MKRLTYHHPPSVVSSERPGGVYIIRNIISVSEYIGSTNDFEKRHDRHNQDLRLERHHSPQLRYALKKYGNGILHFIPLVICDRDYAIALEQKLLDTGRYVYNCNPRASGGPLPGWKQTEDAKARISAARKGKPLSEEHRAKLSASHMGNPGHWTGKKRDPKTGEKIAAALRGQKRPQELCAHLSAVRAEEWASGKRVYRPKEATIARWKEFLRLREEGWTYEKIGALHGICLGAVFSAVKFGKRFFEANP